MPPGGAPLPHATARSSRAAGRKAAAEHAKALANHYSPPSGGEQPHEIHLHRSTTVVDAPAPKRVPFDSGLEHPTSLLNPKTPAPHGPYNPFHAKPSGRSLTHNLGLDRASDYVHEQALKTRMVTRAFVEHPVGYFHGDPATLAAFDQTHIRNGKIVLPKDPRARIRAAGLINPPSPGNMLQRVGFDALAMPTGLVDYGAEALKNPGAAGKDFVKGQADYYKQLATDPVGTFEQDPVMAALSVMPLAHFPGSVVGRGAEVATASRLARGGDATLPEMYRHLPKNDASYFAEHGTLPKLSPLEKTGMLGKAILRSPHPVERTIKAGPGLELHPPASKSYTLGLLQKHVFDRWLQGHLNRGGHLTAELNEGDHVALKDPLARLALGKAGREVRAERRVFRDIQTAPLRRVEKYGQSLPARVVRKLSGKDISALRRGARGGRLSAAQEHAAAIIARGLNVEDVARMHQNAIDRADDLAALEGVSPDEIRSAHENKLHLTKIAGKYLEPGSIHPLVSEASDAMRAAGKARDRMLGITEEQANHAAGSIFFAHHSRANELPDLHDELGLIEEHHGLPAESPRGELEAAISSLHQRIAQSGPENAARLQEQVAQLHGLADDVEHKQHQIAQVDQAIEDLGSQHYRGRMTEHPDGLAATHRELLSHRSALEDQLKALEAHARHRLIHAAFTKKGAELRGQLAAVNGESHVVEERPRTEDEAAQRLAELEYRHGTFRKQVYEKLFGDEKLSPDEMAEQRFRNQENGRAARQASGKTKNGRASGASSSKSTKRPLVRDDRWQIVDAEIEKALERAGDSPEANRMRQETQEIEQLRSGLETQPEEIFGRRSRTAEDIGTVSEKRQIQISEDSPKVIAGERLVGQIAPQLDHAQVAGLERHYGVEGKWTDEQSEAFRDDMLRAKRREPVPPAVQTVYNAALVAPPEAYHLPFMFDRKPIGRIGQGLPRASEYGFGPASKPARHAFTGRILDIGAYRTNATALMAHSFSKAAHFESMSILHEMLLSLSKPTQDEAGGASAVPIRMTKQIPDSLRQEVYSLYPGDILQGEAVDDLASKLFEAWTAPPEHGEDVRWLNRNLIRPLEPRTMGAATRWVNNVNQAFRFGRFLSPAYIKWLPQNLTLHLVQAGPFVFRNAAKMMTEVHKLDPEVYAEIANAVGFGSARALEESSATALRSTTRKISHGWAAINDHIPRMLSFIHEAQREGFRTAKDWENLMRDPRLEARRSTIIRRANKEAIDYGAMTGSERQMLQGLFAYWPWVRAASLYAARFPFEHPYQAALYMQFSRKGEDTINRVFAEHGGVAPSYLEGSYPAKGGPVDLGWANPWEQLGEDAHALSGLFPGHPEELGAGLGTLSPLGKGAEEAISGRDAYGNPLKGGPLKGAGKDLAKRFGPVSIFDTATQPQTGAIPKGPLPALEKFVGDPQLQGYDYDKGAKNALKDVANEPRERFKLEQAWKRFSPEEQAALLPQAKVALRVAQIRDSKSGTEKTRALELVSAASSGTSLADLNSLLVANKLKPFSPGDLVAEKARIRAVRFP